MRICDWCGEYHPIEQLCHARPKWGRRGFLALCGMGLAGLAWPGYTTFTTMFANGQVIGELASIAQLGPPLDIWDLGLSQPTSISFRGTFDDLGLRDGDVFKIRFQDGQDWTFPAAVERQGRDGLILRPIGPAKVTG